MSSSTRLGYWWTRRSVASASHSWSPRTRPVRTWCASWRRGATPQAAESLARAVADSEVSYEQSASSSLSKAEQDVLDARQSDLEKQLTTVNNEIKRTKRLSGDNPPASPQARAAQTAIAQLTGQQASLALDIEAIKSQRSGQQTGPGASIVQNATPATRPRLVVWMVLSALLFALVGIALAACVVIALARRDPRLRTRDDIADALGSPVLGSVKSHRVRTTAAWSELLESYRPSPVDAWSLRQVLDRIGAGPASRRGRWPGRESHGEPVDGGGRGVGR